MCSQSRNAESLLMRLLVCGHLILLRTTPEPFRARTMGLCVVGDHPILSKVSYSHGLGLKKPSRSGARALHDSALVRCMVTYQFLNCWNLDAGVANTRTSPSHEKLFT